MGAGELNLVEYRIVLDLTSSGWRTNLTVIVIIYIFKTEFFFLPQNNSTLSIFPSRPFVLLVKWRYQQAILV